MAYTRVFRVATFATGIGTLKCYDIKGALENCADQPPLIARTSVRHMRTVSFEEMEAFMHGR
jgi:hypothetical protein